MKIYTLQIDFLTFLQYWAFSVYGRSQNVYNSLISIRKHCLALAFVLLSISIAWHFFAPNPGWLPLPEIVIRLTCVSKSTAG